MRAAGAFASVADLLQDDTLGYSPLSGARWVAEGDQIRVVRGGFTYCVASPDSVDAHHLTTVGGVKLIVEPVQGLFDGQAFGAVHDGVTDDAPAYAAAFDAAEQSAQSLGTSGVFIPSGITLWNSGIQIGRTGNHIAIKGAGRRSSAIHAGHGVAGPLLTLGQSEGIFSRFEVQGIAFNLCDCAPTALDMTYCRFSDVHHCDFLNPPLGADPMIKIGRWVNRFWMNHCNGLNVLTNTQTATPILIPSDTINDLQIYGNSFTSFEHPVTCLGNPHDLKIHANTFDHCLRAAVFLKSGGRNVTIENNYFESCGSDAVDMGCDLFGGTTISATVIGDWGGGSATTLIENLIIRANQFANCKGGRLAAFSGLRGLRWYENHALRQFSYDHAVSIVGDAIGQSTQSLSQILIDQSNFNQQFNSIVELAGNDNDSAHSGMQIIERFETGVRGLLHPTRDLVPTDLQGTGWILSRGTLTQAGFFEATQPIFELTGDATLICDIPCDPAFSGWAGRYIRCNYLTRGTADLTNGVNFEVFVDTGSGLTRIGQSARSFGEHWGIGGRNMTLHIPRNATSLRFRIRQLDSNGPVQIARLAVDSAASDLRW